MHKKILKFTIVFVVIFSWVFGYPPVYENLWRARIFNFPSGINKARAAIVEVTITAAGNFSPEAITIISGDQVRWISQSAFVEEPGSDSHTVPFEAGHNIYPALNVGPINPGGSATTPLLTQVGTWGYHNHACGDSCSGTIVIIAAAKAPASGGGGLSDTTPPKISNIKINDSISSQVTVTWSTDDLSKSSIVYDTENHPATDIIFYKFKKPYDNLAIHEFQHSFQFMNLTASTTYYFRILSRNSDGFATTSNELMFNTHAVEAEMPMEVSSTLIKKTIFVFTKTLRRGMKDDEVKELQKFLAQDKDLYSEGLVTAYFGPLTRAAVQRFQATYGIVSSGDEETTGYGRVGPKTRTKLNELLHGR